MNHQFFSAPNLVKVDFMLGHKTYHRYELKNCIHLGAWIVEWSLHLTREHWYAMPWAVRSSLGADNSFSDPSTTSTHYFMISIWFIWSDTTLFVCQVCHWIVKQKKENKISFFKRIVATEAGPQIQVAGIISQVWNHSAIGRPWSIVALMLITSAIFFSPFELLTSNKIVHFEEEQLFKNCNLFSDSIW